jgi:hypothetical protein
MMVVSRCLAIGILRRCTQATAQEFCMPLSEDEQRILRQIEEQLQRDPGFGRTLHQRDSGNRRMLIGSGIGAVVGLVLTVALLSVSPYLSFLAFAGALAAALVCERHARSLGEAGLGHLSETMRGRFGQASQPRSDD